MTAHLTGTDQARVARGGMTALSAADGLALLDQALGADEALLVAARISVATLRARVARGEDIPTLWRTLATRTGSSARPSAAVASDKADGLRRQLAGLPAIERGRALLDLVRAHVAAVVGHASTDVIEPDRPFRELGFDSLTAIELRNRLNTMTGLRLPATLVFDYPTAAALSGYVQARIADQDIADRDLGQPPAQQELDQLESVLARLAANNDERSRIITRLESLVQDLRSGAVDNVSAYHEINTATDEEIFELIDNELGT